MQAAGFLLVREKRREEEARDHCLRFLPPQTKGRKSWEQRVNRNEEAVEEEPRVWETGKPEKGRKKEIHGGGRDQERKRQEKERLQEAPALTSATGAAAVTRESWASPGTAQAGLLCQEPGD